MKPSLFIRLPRLVVCLFAASALFFNASMLLAQQSSVGFLPKSLTVGNRFVYSVNGKLLVEEVTAERTVANRVYAVIRNRQTGTERLERSDERGIYEYRSGAEQILFSFTASVGDSIAWTDGTGVENRSALLSLREIGKQTVLGQQVRAFAGNYRSRQSGSGTGGGMYAERFGFASSLLFGTNSRTNRSVQLRGAVLNGTVFGDTTTVIPPRPKKAPIAVFSTTMPKNISPNTNLQFYLPDTVTVSIWIFTKQNRLVRKIIDNALMAEGDNTVSWNGTNDDGRLVSPGDYWCILMMNGRETDRVELTNNDKSEVVVFQTSGIAAQRAMLQGASASVSIPLEFYLAKTGNVNVSIFSLDGKLIRTVVNERRILGEQSAVWDGRDSENKVMAKGPYLCVVTSERGGVARTVIMKP
jgi:flagellar hook assembly protein FlgD